MRTDIEIAQATPMTPILDIARTAGIDEKYVELYGRYKAKLDLSLLEAAQDLDADRKQTFMRVILPLSMPGVISGISMVFLPAMTNYVVLDMLYNSTYIMGSLIGSYFSAYNWHGGSMISLILLALICIFTLLSSDRKEETRGGSRL